MPMAKATLSTELQNMTPTESEASAISALVDAYATYASAATGAGVPITPAGIELGKGAMAPALVGMSADGAGNTKIPAAIVAFWGAVCTGFATSFPGSIAATPPPFANLPTTFPATTAANTSGEKTLAQSMDAIAGVIHSGRLLIQE